MKPLFRCEYCDKIGVAEEIEKHESECIHNRTKRSCFTCKHANKQGFSKFICACGKQIEADHYYRDCDSYEWDGEDHTTRNPIASNNLFGGIFL